MNKNQETAKRVRGLGQGLRLGLYITLALSALTTFIGLPALQLRVQSGQLGPGWLIAPSIAFGVALAVYLFDRIYLVRYRHYPPGRALFQVAFGLIFMFLLFPSSLKDYRQVVRQRPPRDSLLALMKHSDARVRALAYEVAATRQGAKRFVAGLAQGLLDHDAQAAKRAQASLQKITGRRFALGQLPDPAALKAPDARAAAPDLHIKIPPAAQKDAGGSSEDAAAQAGGPQ